MIQRRNWLSFSMLVVGLYLLALGGTVLAQGTAPIQIGQNATGTLSAEANTASFALTANAGDTVMIQVLAISAGFTPNFRVLNSAGVEVLNVANPDGKATLTGNAALGAAGVYTIVIGGENGSTGQFVLSLQAGAPLPPPTALVLNQPILATVGAETPVQVYRFDTTSLGAVGVSVLSQTPDAGALVTVFDETASKTIASSDADVVGVTYQLPAAGHAYRVEVRASGAGDTVFSVCMGTCGTSSQAGNTGNTGNTAPAPTPQAAAPIATPEVAATTCMAASSAGGAVNLRSGPGTKYAVLNTLPLGQTAQVIGVWTGGGWYEVTFNGGTLWVGGSVVSLSGDCTALPAVAAPANAPLAPTAVPTRNGNNGNNSNNGNNGNNGGDNNAPTPTDTPAANLPNLTTTDIEVSNPGDGTLNIDIHIINAGTAPVDSPYAVKTCLDNTTCDEIPGFAAGLQPGETMSFTDSLPFPANGGNHTITVTVDSQNQVTESNEGDNGGFASFNS